MIKKIVSMLIFSMIFMFSTGFVGVSKWTSTSSEIYMIPNSGTSVIAMAEAGSDLLMIEEVGEFSKVYCKEVGTWGYIKTAVLVDIRPYSMPLPTYVDNTKTSNIIRIGDSRVAQMYEAISEEERAKSSWIASASSGYPWLMSTVVPMIDSMNIEGKIIVIQLGVNDIMYSGSEYTKANYSAFYNTKAIEWMNRGAKVYYNEIWPIRKDQAVNTIIASTQEDSDFIAYNDFIEKSLPAGISYMSYNEAKSIGKVIPIETLDGVHFTKDVYQSIYQNEMQNY